MRNRAEVKRVVLVGGYTLAASLGVYLAYLFLRFLNTHIDFVHPTDTQRLLMVLGSVVFGILAYSLLLAGLAKGRNSECKKYYNPNKRGNSPCPRTLHQLHETIVTEHSCDDKTKDPKKYPTCLSKKLFHVKKSISQKIKRGNSCD